MGIRLTRTHATSQPSSLAVLLATFIVIVALGGCMTVQRAEEAGLRRDVVPAPPFELTVWSRGLGHRAPALHVYIEGDGRAYVRRRLSADPTPRRAMGLVLASADPSPAVLYIARPCQFTSRELLGRCDPRYWSSHRYARDVVDAIDTVLDWAQAKWPHPPPLVLTGFSGGATLAAVLAIERDDVAALVTVAGNLDHQAWTAHHGVTPLRGSINPIHLPQRNDRTVPQLHLVGKDDTRVPPAIVRRYVEQRGIARSTLREVSGFDHDCCWDRLWPEPVCELSPACRATTN